MKVARKSPRALLIIGALTSNAHQMQNVSFALGIESICPDWMAFLTMARRQW